MESQDTDSIISIDGRSWRFPGARIDTDSWEIEWCSDAKLYLHDSIGEGTELSEAEIEQLAREMLLADVLELAAAQLRCGEGWDEGTTRDVLNEVLHTYPSASQKGSSSGFEHPNLTLERLE